MDVFAPATGPDDTAVLHDRLAANDGGDRPTAGLPIVIEAVIGVGAELGGDRGSTATIQGGSQDRQLHAGVQLRALFIAGVALSARRRTVPCSGIWRPTWRRAIRGVGL